jgi:hypothetical protein
MKYKIVKNEGEGQNEFDKVIEISGLKSEITINQVLGHLHEIKKMKKGQEAQIVANNMLNEKAVEALPVLGEIAEDKYHLAFSFFAKKEANKQSEGLIKEADDAIEKYETHLKAIEKELGIKCLPVESPIEVKYEKGAN